MNNHQNQHGGNPYKKIEEVAQATAELAKVTGEKVGDLFERTETLKAWHNEAVDAVNFNGKLLDDAIDKINEIADVVNRQHRQIRKLQQSNTNKSIVIGCGVVGAFAISLILATAADEHTERIDKQTAQIRELQEEIYELRAQCDRMRVQQKANEMDG